MLKKIVSAAAVLTLAFGMTSCKLDKEEPHGKIQFQLYDGAFQLEGTQQFKFGETKAYKLHSRYVTTMKVVAPFGWEAEFYNGGDDGSVVISAPASPEVGETAGNVVVNLTGPDTQQMDDVVKVIAL